MAVVFELLVHTSCCGRIRLVSETVLTVWTVGGGITATARCKDSEWCEASETEQLREAAAPFWERLRS
jgi:hypothetical protein